MQEKKKKKKVAGLRKTSGEYEENMEMDFWLRTAK